MILVFGLSRRKQPAADRDARSATQPAVGAKSWPGDMDEHRAAAAGDAGPGIVVDFDDQVVEPSCRQQPVAWFIGRPPERPIIAPVRRVLAPGVDRRRSGGPATRCAAAADDRRATTAEPGETARAACRRRPRACQALMPARPSATGSSDHPAEASLASGRPRPGADRGWKRTTEPPPHMSAHFLGRFPNCRLLFMDPSKLSFYFARRGAAKRRSGLGFDAEYA